MDTPIQKMLEDYIREGMARMHMPGHKGILPEPLAGAAAYDITEIQGADSLFECDGVIRRCEEAFARRYGAKESLISCGGSTLCIQAMLALAAGPGEKVLFFRNIHKAALDAMILLDIRPVWLFPQDSGGEIGCITPQEVAQSLGRDREIRAVYITSPDYYGQIHDIGGIARACHEAGVPLLVDNAHGAHLKFLEEDLHPMTLGADLCCDSLHKTLPALTGSALLHIGSDRFTWAAAKEAMGLFGSTSPSYLMMLSMDMLTGRFAEIQAGTRRAAESCAALRALAAYKGLAPMGDDPMKLTLRPKALGRTGTEFAGRLREEGIECEFADEGHVVLMPSMQTPEEDFIRLREAILLSCRGVSRQSGEGKPPAGQTEASAGGRPQQAMSPRQAYFAPKEHIPLTQAEGRIYGDIRWPCPPAVPAIMPGEVLDKRLCKIFAASGKTQVKVVK